MLPPGHARHVLGLYRAILRVARELPGKRPRLVRQRAREDFRANAGTACAEEVAQQVLLAEVQLETLTIQRAQLADLSKRPCH